MFTRARRQCSCTSFNAPTLFQLILSQTHFSLFFIHKNGLALTWQGPTIIGHGLSVSAGCLHRDTRFTPKELKKILLFNNLSKRLSPHLPKLNSRFATFWKTIFIFVTFFGKPTPLEGRAPTRIIDSPYHRLTQSC